LFNKPNTYKDSVLISAVQFKKIKNMNCWTRAVILASTASTLLVERFLLEMANPFATIGRLRARLPFKTY
jgi:hypothetical protein